MGAKKQLEHPKKKQKSRLFSITQDCNKKRFLVMRGATLYGCLITVGIQAGLTPRNEAGCILFFRLA
jgi:hypothetical protein